MFVYELGGCGFEIPLLPRLYLIINKINEYIEENKYLTLFHSDKSKNTLKTYEDILRKIRDLIRSITKSRINKELNSLHNSDSYVAKK